MFKFKKILLIIFLSATMAFATTPINTNVTRLYIATFDRAPDADGLKYWVEESGLYLEEIAMSFFDQSETQAKYPDGYSNEDFIKSIYKNLFNRNPDTAGLAYWQDALDQKLIPRSLFILAITNGAIDDDKKILDNKTAVGLAFATAGATDIDQAYTLMQHVTADEESTLALICDPEIEYCDDFYKGIGASTDNNTSTSDSEDEEVVILLPPSVIPPTISDGSGNVLENASTGAIVSRISILKKGDSDISAITLSGTGSTNFESSIGGQVTVKAGATLDYDTNPSYNLDVVATNRAGNSNTAELSILVTDVATDVPSLSNFSKTIPESTTQSTKIGTITVTTNDSPITLITLSGAGYEDFTVATNGDISLASAVDYESKASYSLTAIARNGAGASNEATVTITITNIDDEKPTLTSYTNSMAENTTTGTQVGDIIISKEGDSDITDISLTGDGNAKFSVSTTGEITLKSALDYETKTSYTLQAIATNGAGSSDAVSVTLTVTNIAESRPLLVTPSAFSLDENTTIGTKVGTITTSGTTDENIVTGYTIQSGNTDTAFLISTTGAITTAKTLDYATTPSYDLSIFATNDFGNSTSITVTINITEAVD